jgi:hypothetical protein
MRPTVSDMRRGSLGLLPPACTGMHECTAYLVLQGRHPFPGCLRLERHQLGALLPLVSRADLLVLKCVTSSVHGATWRLSVPFNGQ